MAKQIPARREGRTELHATPPGSAVPTRQSPKKQSQSGSNTAAFPYFDGQSFPSVCEADRKRIQDKCHTDRGVEESRASFAKARTDESQHAPDSLPVRLQRPFRRAIQAIDSVGKKKSGYERNPKNQWMEDHCTGLWIKPGGESQGGKNIQDFERQIADALNSEKETAKNMQSEILKELQNLAKHHHHDYLGEPMGAAATKAAAAERAAKSTYPALMSLVGQTKAFQGLGKLIGNTSGASASDSIAKRLLAMEGEVSAAQTMVDELAGFSQGKVEDAMASTQAGVAFANPCLWARKCMLVPYKDAGNIAKGSGCCIGQTGHHVLPDAMFYDYEIQRDTLSGKYRAKKKGKRSCWSAYKHADAPTICLEGTTNRATNGSHGMAHKWTGIVLERHRWLSDVKYSEVSAEISRILATSFHCDLDCISAQLNAYYKQVHVCGSLEDAKVACHSGEARPFDRETGSATI